MKHLSNLLTFIRLLLVPVFPIAFFSSDPLGPFIALAVFVLAGFTDFLDGYIARRFHQITPLGTVLDPLADKLMLLTVLLTLWHHGTLPLWILLIIILKETFMIVTGAYLYFRKSKFIIPSNRYGKAATALLFLAIPLRILMPDNSLALIIIFMALGLMFVALLRYTQYYLNHREHNQEPD